MHLDALVHVGDYKIGFEAVGRFLHAAVFDHAAEAKHLVHWRLACQCFGRREEEHEVALEGVQHEQRCGREPDDAADDDRQPFMSWFHDFSFRSR